MIRNGINLENYIIATSEEHFNREISSSMQAVDTNEPETTLLVGGISWHIIIVIPGSWYFPVIIVISVPIRTHHRCLDMH